jgi:hypothetical protein
VGVASQHQPLPFWIRSVGVLLRVTAMVPAVPVARLMRGSEIYVAPRLRLQPEHAAAAAGNVLQPGSGVSGGIDTTGRRKDAGSSAGRQGSEGSDEDGSAAPLQTALRVQRIGEDAAAGPLSPASNTTPATGTHTQQQQEQLPPGVQIVLASADTLARCGLAPGDWVRVAGRHCRSLVKFACLAASELAAPGHLALTAAQCEWAGAPPCSHVQLQRLTRGQRQLIWEAAELQQAGSKVGGRKANSGDNSTQQRSAGSGTAAATTSQQQQQQQQAKPGSGTMAALAGAGWLREAAEAALRRLLPVLGFTPRSLLQSWGVPRPGGLLVCGPAGSGKTALLAATAAVLGAHPECLTYTVTLSCRELSAEGAQQAQAQILPKVGACGQMVSHCCRCCCCHEPVLTAASDSTPGCVFPALPAGTHCVCCACVCCVLCAVCCGMRAGA